LGKSLGIACLFLGALACSDFKLVSSDLSPPADLSPSADLTVCVSITACNYPQDRCAAGSQCYPYGKLATSGPGYCLPVGFRTGCNPGTCGDGVACYLDYAFCLDAQETACVCASAPQACSF
jgi:hypothetical protein